MLRKHYALAAAAVLLVTASGLPQARRRAGGGAAITVGAVEPPRGRNMECSCGFRSVLPGTRTPTRIFISEIGSAVGSLAWMNIDGQVRSLRLTSRTEPAKPVRAGSRWVQIYSGDGVTARVTFIIAPPYPSLGDSMSYSAILVVSAAGRNRTLRAKGSCC